MPDSSPRCWPSFRQPEFGLFGAPLLARAFVDTDEDVQQREPDAGRGRGPTAGQSVVAARGPAVLGRDDWRSMELSPAEQVIRIAERLADKDQQGRVRERWRSASTVSVWARVVDTLKAAAVKVRAQAPQALLVRCAGDEQLCPTSQGLGGSQAATATRGRTGTINSSAQMHGHRMRLESHEQLGDELRGCRSAIPPGKCISNPRRKSGRAEEVSGPRGRHCLCVGSGI